VPQTPAPLNSGPSNPIPQALRAIKYIAEKSTTAYFKRACSGTASGPIREALKWSGPQDPLSGNTLNVRVRESAQAALDEVFRVQAPGHGAPAATNPDLAGRIRGYGSTTGSTGVASAAPSKYSGFGNPAFESGSLAAPSAARTAPRSDYAVGLMSSAPSGDSLPPPLPRAELAPAARDGASLVGTEAAVVAELCAASGLRAQPHPDQLRAFVDRVPLLDPDVVAVELTGFLADDTAWQSAVRALCTLEAVALAALEPGADESVRALAGVFRATPDSVRVCAAHAQAYGGLRALKCLAALGVDAGAAAAPRASAPQAMPDLLGGLDDSPPLTQAPASDPLADLLGEPAAAPAAGGDLFSGMMLVEGGTNGHAAAAADMFAGLSVSDASQTQPAYAPDFLADLMGPGLPEPAAAAQTAAVAAAAAAPPDLFADLAPAGGGGAPLREKLGSDLFADLAPPPPPAPAAPQFAARPAFDSYAGAGAASSTAPQNHTGFGAPQQMSEFVPSHGSGGGQGCAPQTGMYGGPGLGTPYNQGFRPQYAAPALGEPGGYQRPPPPESYTAVPPQGLYGAPPVQQAPPGYGAPSYGAPGGGLSVQQPAALRTRSASKPKDAFDFVNDEIRR